MVDKSNEYGYVPSSPTQADGSNTGIFEVNDVTDLLLAGQWTLQDLGKLELIETFNASAVSSFDFSTLGTYNVHFLTYNNLFNSSIAKGFGIRLYESGVLETASVYQLAIQYGDSSGNFNEARSPAYNAWQFSANTNIPTYSKSRANGYWYFYNLTDSSKYSFGTNHNININNANDTDTRFGSYVLPQASEVTAIQVYGYDIGNITGTFSLYGIAES
jgi:hypothetical protein